MSGELTADELERIRERVNKATAGPWVHEPYGGQNQNGAYVGGHIFDASGEYLLPDVPHDDGEFIASARQDVPKLLAHIDAHAQRVQEARAQEWDRAAEYMDRMADIVDGPNAPVLSRESRANALAFRARATHIRKEAGK